MPVLLLALLTAQVVQGAPHQARGKQKAPGKPAAVKPAPPPPPLCSGDYADALPVEKANAILDAVRDPFVFALRKAFAHPEASDFTSMCQIEQLGDRLLVRSRKFVLVHLLGGDPAVIVHLLVVDLPLEQLAAIDAEVDVVVRIGVLDVDDAVADVHLDLHLLAQLARQGGLVSLSLFHPSPGEFPQERQGRGRTALGDQVLAVLLEHRGDDPDLRRHSRTIDPAYIRRQGGRASGRQLPCGRAAGG